MCANSNIVGRFFTARFTATGLVGIVLLGYGSNSQAGSPTQTVRSPAAQLAALAEDGGKILGLQQLQEQIGTESGQLDVIVSLKEIDDAQADGLDTNLALKRKARIAERCARVQSRVSADKIRIKRQLVNQASFSAQVSLDALAQLLADPDVEFIEPNGVLEAHDAQGLPLMNALATRDQFRGAGVSIAICDTGIDASHPALGGGGYPNAKVIGGYDFGMNDSDPTPRGEAHGTACAGIAAGAELYYGDYIGGVAPDARLYALKITRDNDGRASLDSLAAAWDWCVTHQFDDPSHPIMVISTSFGGQQLFGPCDGSYVAMSRAAQNATRAGITIFASSGNEGFCNALAAPACLTDVISVGAVYDSPFGVYQPCIKPESCVSKMAAQECPDGWYTIDQTSPDQVTSYSNSAGFLDVLAPSNQTYTADILGSSGYASGDYVPTFGGTSAACPYAAGAAAVMQSAAFETAGHFLSPSEVRSLLTNTGDSVWDSKSGISKPRVNLGQALAQFESVCKDEDCDDGVFCNGRERCINGQCAPGTNPCRPTESCDESLRGCFELVTIDPDDEFEENDTLETAASIAVGSFNNLQGQDDDWYILQPDRAGILNVEIVSADGDLDLHVTDSQGRVLGGSEGADSNESVRLEVDGQQIAIAVTPRSSVKSAYQMKVTLAGCDSDVDCNDGNFCNGAESCVNGTCVAGTSPCWVGEICNEATGECATAECMVNSDCDDSDLCTVDACTDGQCVNTDVVCGAGRVCNPDDGTCVGCLDHADCDDGLFCNGAEFCYWGECSAEAPPCSLSEACNEAADVCGPRGDGGRDDQFEDNDDSSHAAVILPSFYSLVSRDSDWFLLRSPGFGWNRIAATGQSGDVELVIYDENLTRLISTVESSRLSVHAKANEYLYIEVRPHDNQGAEYVLGLDFEPFEEPVVGDPMCGSIGTEALVLIGPGLLGFLGLSSPGIGRHRR